MNCIQELMMISWIKQVVSCDDRTLMSFLQGWTPKSERSAASDLVDLLRLCETTGELRSDTRYLGFNGISVRGRRYNSKELAQLYRMHGKVACRVKFLTPCSAVILVFPPGDGPPAAAFDVLEERLVAHIASFLEERRLQLDPAERAKARSERSTVHLRHLEDFRSSLRTGADSRFQLGASGGASDLNSLDGEGGGRDERS